MSDNQNFTYLKIYERLKKNIHEGKIPKDSKLDSIRNAALHQGVSTTTMEHAYNQLLIEGYIRSVPRKGFYIEAIPSSMKNEKEITKPKGDEIQTPFNLAQTPDMFEVDRFRKIMNEVLANEVSIYTPCLPRGEWDLRKAIASHLRHARDVVCTPEEVLVASGIQQLIIALGEMESKSKNVAYLKPGFSRALHAFRISGFSLNGFETVEALLKSNPDFIYLSPSNLYPSGEVMPINERMKIIEHANKQGTILLEDDYNHLFRYNAYQIPTLYSLSSKDNVVYIGSFSRSTLLSIRMSYMVIPGQLEHHDVSVLAQTVSKPDQLTMAHFIERGHYQRHLKRLARLSKRKNDALKKAVEPYLEDGRFLVYGLESNMHFVIRLENAKDRMKIINQLKSMDMAFKTFDEERPMDVLVPYSGIEIDSMQPMIDQIMSVF